jgi:DNA-3-methyladenine glycosylase
MFDEFGINAGLVEELHTQWLQSPQSVGEEWQRFFEDTTGTEGHAYVFLVYGMHECFNVTCRGVGAGHAVLVRAAEPLLGFAEGTRLDGPGRFAKAMGLSRADDGADVTEPPIYLVPRDRRPRIVTTARVGVAYAAEYADVPWRFYDAASKQVSRPPKSAIGAARG